MKTPPTTAEPTPPRTAAAAPRLAIWHFMVWTALVAVLMAIHPRLPQTSLALGGEAALQVLWAMRGGAALGGILLLVARRWRGLRFPDEPGEWVLVVHGASLLCFLAFVFVQQLLSIDQSELGGRLYIPLWIYSVAVFLVGAAPLALAHMRGPWRWFFVAMAVMYSAQLAFMGLIATGQYEAIPILVNVVTMILITNFVLVAVATAFDWFGHTPRGWVHWTGVVCLLVSVGTTIWEMFLS